MVVVVVDDLDGTGRLFTALVEAALPSCPIAPTMVDLFFLRFRL
jgi:hypothetical protein